MSFAGPYQTLIFEAGRAFYGGNRSDLPPWEPGATRRQRFEEPARSPVEPVGPRKMTPVALLPLLLASSPQPAASRPQVDTDSGETRVHDQGPATEVLRAKAFEFGAQFGGLAIIDNPLASSSMYLGLRAGYRLPRGIEVGLAGQYSDFSSRTYTGSEFSFWTTRAELGYELSEVPWLSVLPYAQLGYANTNSLYCSEERVCARRLAHGAVGALGLRLATLGDWYYSGLELNYQVGHVQTLFVGFSTGFRY